MVHLGVQAVAGTGTPLGIIPAGTGNDVARYFDLPAQGPARRRRAGARRPHPRPSTWPAAARSTSPPCCAAGFDAVVNERANRMTWPQGPDALQHRHPGRAAHVRAAARTPSTWTARPLALEAMLVAVGNGPSFGGGLRITEGAILDDGLLDVVIIKPMSKAGAGPHLPEALQGHPHHAPAVRAPPGPLGDGRGAGHRRRTPTASASARCRSPSSARRAR